MEITMKYALALAGGGTRGAFQAGVKTALDELGKEVCAIAGTSIGAVNGAVFAMGNSAVDLWAGISVNDIVDVPDKNSNLLSPSSIFDFAKNASEGGFDNTPFRDFLNTVIDEEAIRRSGTDYGLCTFSIDTKKSVELFIDKIPEGQLTEYILASACFPMFRPVTIDGASFSDGGLRNNLPLNMLIDRGYDTIISVSVRGIGLLREADKCGVNVIKINSPSPEVGLMEFDRDAIVRSIKSGYFECMKSFCRYCGDIYYIDTASYHDAVSKFGTAPVSGMEQAAKLLNIDRFRGVTFESLSKEVLSTYESNLQLRLLTGYIKKGKSSFVRENMDILGERFAAANAVVYLEKHL